MKTPTTPAGIAIVARLEEDARAWDARLGDELDTFTRYIVTAKRDTCRDIARWIGAEIVKAEREAIEGVDADIEAIERALGWVPA